MADPATRYVHTPSLPHMSPFIILIPPLSLDLVVQHGQGQGLPPRSLQRTPHPAFPMALPLLLRGVSPHYLLTPMALVLRMHPKIASSSL